MKTKEHQLDPRGVRFNAWVTFGLTAIALLLGFGSAGLIFLVVVALLFIPGAIIGPQATLTAEIFRAWIRPRLPEPAFTIGHRAPRFAQQLGLAMSAAGVLSYFLDWVWGYYVFAGLLALASLLNAAVGFCLGCEMYRLAHRRGRHPQDTSSNSNPLAEG